MPIPTAPRRAIHVLLADDDTELCTLLSERLHERGYTVHVVNDGDELARALGLMDPDRDPGPNRGPAIRPDVILADIFMPGQTGVTLARIVREAELGIPVVLMTGTNSGPWRRSSAGIAVAVLQKPFDIGELEAALNLAIGSGPIRVPEDA